MLTAVAGSQGTGKSTTLNAIKQAGFNIIERKTSRSILSDWGVSLQEVNNDPELTTKFQDEISLRKFQDESEAIASDEMWFTERTHSDLFAYALISLGKDNQYSDWLNDYYTKCLNYNKDYQRVCYLTAGHFDVVHDGTRGSNKHYSRMVELTMLDFTIKMVEDGKLTLCTTPDLTERVNTITKQ